ncbi:MAG: long-chain fatty acid--CoA ligase [Acetobacteraceae bacterium]|nr:long-chain fatty acid--CoA ligase [Acetobacteraceae bacterium]
MPDAPFPGLRQAKTLPALLDLAVAQFAQRPALEFMGRRWTYSELGEWVDRAAKGLQQLGIKPGDRVGLCLPNTPYFVVFYFATLRAAAIVVNFNPLYSEPELRNQISDSGTKLMVVPDLAMIYPKVRAVADEAGLSWIVVCPMGGILPPVKAALFPILRYRSLVRPSYDDRVLRLARVIGQSGSPASIPIGADDVAVLQYTGGTTGTPKGAMLTHRNLTANCHQVLLHVPSLRLGEERTLAVLPLFHVFAMTAVMNSGIATGTELLLHPRFEIGAVVRAIHRQRPTILHGVPTVYAAISSATEKRRCDLSSLRFCISGGAPLAAELRKRFEKLTNCKLVEGYGLTEASPVVACNPLDGRIKDGSVGIPMADTVIEIREPDKPGRTLPTGAKGEICVRGPQVMKGYWKRPEETAAVFVKGALRTGDIGYLDEDGYLFIVDRIKDLILCSGYNVYPRVLEEALYQHPAVAEAVVIGVPDAYRGQAPKAFVTLRAGAQTQPEELLGFLSARLSKIEMPRQIEIRDSLPRTMIGKLSKKELIAEEAKGSRHETTGER